MKLLINKFLFKYFSYNLTFLIRSFVLLFNKKILNRDLISGKKIYGLKTDEHLDIDRLEDIKNLKKQKKNFINFNHFIKS